MPLLQMMAQKRQLDVLTIHQNGSSYDYRWANRRLQASVPRPLDLHPRGDSTGHVGVPLSYLINVPVDVVFWCDHDDIYYANHTDRMLHTLCLAT